MLMVRISGWIWDVEVPLTFPLCVIGRSRSSSSRSSTGSDLLGEGRANHGRGAQGRGAATRRDKAASEGPDHF